MILVYEPQECCGCAACANICSQKAITMKPAKDGFLYPAIAAGRCTNCGLCRVVCRSRTSNMVKNGKPLATYAAINKDMNVLKSSSSGGVFTALASIVFEKKGVVFGCAFDNELNAEHICVDKREDLQKLQGSKYVQSSIRDAYNRVLDHLRSGRLVLFTGTPCQIGGLKAYLGADYSNLITADVICHGVPSQAFFKDYIGCLESELGGRVIDFRFRDKSCGSPGYIAKIVYKKNGMVLEKLMPWFTSYYYDYFLKGHILRDSCYECMYTHGSRPGDISIGDYWGVQTFHPELDTSNGVSLLLINTEKGMSLIEGLARMVSLVESTFEKAATQNAQLSHPPAKSSKRQKIFHIWYEGGSRAVAQNYYRSHVFQVAMLKLRGFVPKSVKLVIKKILAIIT